MYVHFTTSSNPCGALKANTCTAYYGVIEKSLSLPASSKGVVLFLKPVASASWLQLSVRSICWSEREGGKEGEVMLVLGGGVGVSGEVEREGERCTAGCVCGWEIAISVMHEMRQWLTLHKLVFIYG